MEIRRFGVGRRRPDGPPGTRGVLGQVIHSDGRGLVTELAFGRNAAIEPHANPNTTWFVVIEGGGFVLVADERDRIAAGEAVLWPAGIIHSAWTEISEMRAIVVEFAGSDDAGVRGLLTAPALPVDDDELASGSAGSGEGRLVRLDGPRRGWDRSSGEPL